MSQESEILKNGVILKEGEGDNLGFHNFRNYKNGDYPKRRFPISFIGIGDFENIRILKEGRGII